jgi:hypothetical protein
MLWRYLYKNSCYKEIQVRNLLVILCTPTLYYINSTQILVMLGTKCAKEWTNSEYIWMVLRGCLLYRFGGGGGGGGLKLKILWCLNGGEGFKVGEGGGLYEGGIRIFITTHCQVYPRRSLEHHARYRGGGGQQYHLHMYCVGCVYCTVGAPYFYRNFVDPYPVGSENFWPGLIYI